MQIVSKKPLGAPRVINDSTVPFFWVQFQCHGALYQYLNRLVIKIVLMFMLSNECYLVCMLHDLRFSFLKMA